MWCWQCLWLEWTGKGWDISLEQVTLCLLGVISASEASKGLSGTMWKRRDVVLESPCGSRVGDGKWGKKLFVAKILCVVFGGAILY